jgi:YD repeat-containing protein
MRSAAILSIAIAAAACGSEGTNEGFDAGSGDPDGGGAPAPDGGGTTATRLYPGPCVYQWVDLVVDELELRVTITYDAEDHAIASEADYDGDGIVDSTDAMFYQGDLLIRTEIDWDPDGAADQITTYEYDAAGRLIATEDDWVDPADTDQRLTHIWQGDLHVRTEGDDDIDGTIDSVTTYVYYPDDRLQIMERDTDNDPAANYRETWTYDDAARTARTSIDFGANGEADDHYLREYDAGGRLIREDRGVVPGQFTGIRILFSYDSFGNRLREDMDQFVDGPVDILGEYFYDCFE